MKIWTTYAHCSVRFEKLYEQTQIIRQLRLISRQFEALVSPLVFRNVRLDDQLGVHLGNMGVPGATPALQRTAIYVMKYARNVTISSLNAVPNYTANAIRRMKCFRLLRLEFLERTCMNGDGVAFSLLRDCFLDFEVVIESETDQMTLTYEARGSPRPELRSIEVDIGKRVIFADFGVDIAEWDTLETLTINGYLRMDPTKSWCNLRTLKMDSRSDKRSFQKPMSSIQMLELNGWFPNLEYLELNIPQRESFVRHHEATAFLESLAAFRNLRYLNLKANPFLVEGSICGVLPGAQSMWSMTECLHIVDVSPRGAAYKARATGMAMNIFKTLLREKQGTLFGELRLSIDARLHGDCEHCLYSVSPENRHCMTTCVPAVSCEWRGHYQTTGEPLVRIECDMDDECVECPRRISMQLLPTTQGSVFDSW